MRAQTISFAFVAAAMIVAGGLVILERAPSDEPPPVAPSNEPLTIAVSDTPAPRSAAPGPAHDGQAAAKIRELEAMSETFRNTSFLIAIRDAGFTCNELLRVYGGFEESGKWTATCSQMLTYTVGVAGDGALRVQPLNVYWDGATGR